MRVFLLALMAIVAPPLTHFVHAHDHLVGRLQIVFSETELTLSLAVPAEGVLGFELPAESGADRAQVAQAISDLSRPLELFVPSEQAVCVTNSANVALSNEGLGEASDSGLAEKPDYRREFQADYEIQCQDTEAVETIRFAFFERFAETSKLVVHVRRPDQDDTHAITRTMPELSIH